MSNRFLYFLVYASTPIMLIIGLSLMYILIRDHPVFTWVAGGYVVLLVLLYAIKLTLFKKYLSYHDDNDIDNLDG